MDIQKLVVGALEENTYVVSQDGVCLLIDPGSDEPADIKKIRDAIGEKELLAIICTHNHFDHIGGIHEFDAPCYMQELDRKNIEFQKTMSTFAIGYEIQIPSEVYKLDEHMRIGPFSFQVIHTPGHTPCGVCFLFDKIMFSGDTVFQGTYGRTDLPFSNSQDMEQSLRRITSLDPKITIHPGHGDDTSVSEVSSWL